MSHTDELLAQLASSDDSVSCAAALALRERGDASAAPALLASLKRDCLVEMLPSALVKARAIAAVGGAAAVTLLLDELHHLDDVAPAGDAGDRADELFRRGQALSVALGLIRPAPVDELLAVLAATQVERGRHPRALNCVAQALGLAADLRAVEPLINFLKTRRRDVTSSTLTVMQALGRLGDRRAVPILIHLLNPPDEVNRGWIRRIAASALGAIGDNRALAPLMSIVSRDPDWFARLGAVEGLTEMGGQEAQEMLRRALRDPHEQVRNAARNALQGRDPG